MNQILEREDLKDMDPELVVGEEVLKYAEHNLGYTHPERGRLVAKSALTNALRIMGLKPFTPLSVERYKAAELRRHQGKLAMIREKTNSIGSLSLFMGLFSMVAFILVSLLSAGQMWVRAFGYTLVSSAITFFLGLLVYAIIGDDSKIKAKWQRRSLKDYDRPVPEFALATAMELHQRVPGATFLIDELVIDMQPKDPFLVVVLAGVEYYVEVWAEPGYKQERMA